MGGFRVAHLSDIHLGYKSGRRETPDHVNVRVQDGYTLLHAIVSDVIAEGVDAVVIAGDMFHSPRPDMRTICVAQDELRRFADANIPVYLLAGNHEAVDSASEIASSRVLHDSERRIYSIIDPYASFEMADGLMLHMVSHHMYMGQSETMSKVAATPGAVNIFTTHGGVIDPIMKMRLRAQQSPREIVIPDHLLSQNAWSAVMLGHIHERSTVQDSAGNSVYYNGSVLRRGFSDQDNGEGRGWTLWTIHPDGSSSYEARSLPQRPQYDFAPIDASGLSAAQVTDLIVENLRSTQVRESGLFVWEDAPILRQRVTGITSAQYSGLDTRLIGDEAAHALSWKLEPLFVSASAPTVSPADGVGGESARVTVPFEQWCATSEALDAVPECQRSLAWGRAEEFIKFGRDASYVVSE